MGLEALFRPGSIAIIKVCRMRLDDGPKIPATESRRLARNNRRPTREAP